MSKPFKKVALLGRSGVRNIPQTLSAVHEYLHTHHFDVVIESNTAQLLQHQITQAIVPADQLNQHADIILVVGGDGSLINAAHIALEQKLPILGINRGRLGFLADIYPDNLTLLDQTLSGDYAREKRFLLASSLRQQDDVLSVRLALNDVVILPGDVAHMIDYDIVIDQQRVCSLRADGLIACTPTGSTAYALSGGGPILHPGLDAIGLVPMFPHTLSNRPIVVNGDSVIEISLPASNDITPYVSCDGQERKAISLTQTIQIAKHPQPLTLIHPSDYNYYETLRQKLGWQK